MERKNELLSLESFCNSFVPDLLSTSCGMFRNVRLKKLKILEFSFWQQRILVETRCWGCQQSITMSDSCLTTLYTLHALHFRCFNFTCFTWLGCQQSVTMSDSCPTLYTWRGLKQCSGTWSAVCYAPCFQVELTTVEASWGILHLFTLVSKWSSLYVEES